MFISAKFDFLAFLEEFTPKTHFHACLGPVLPLHDGSTEKTPAELKKSFFFEKIGKIYKNQNIMFLQSVSSSPQKKLVVKSSKFDFLAFLEEFTPKTQFHAFLGSFFLLLYDGSTAKPLL